MTYCTPETRLIRTALAWSAMFAALCGARPSSAVNLLGNPSFETPDASGGDVPNAPGAPWTAFSDPNVRYTTQLLARTGSQSLKMFGPFDFIGGGVGATQKLPAAPGDTFVGEIYAQNFSGDAIEGNNFGVLKLEFLNASNNLVSGVAGGLLGVDVFESNKIDATTPLDEWTLLGVGTAPAPAGTAFVNLVVVQVQLGTNFMPPFVGGSIFWDDASLTKALTADFDDNGVVNNLDLGIWKGAFNVNAQGDANGDGLSDGADLLAWQRQLGSTAAAAAIGAVPEPAAAALVLAGVAALASRRRRAA